MSDHLEGGCLCGEIRYQITGEPFEVYHCHCTICRRAAAGAFITWVGVSTDDVNFIQGATKIYASSADGRRGFCPTCGAQISFVFESDPASIYFTAATLDDAEAVTPACHGFTGETVRWLHIDDGLPEHSGNLPSVDRKIARVTERGNERGAS